MPNVLIGIDDTDNLTSPGTGKLARWLCEELCARGARSQGITRHQFLVDERIPYTTHNSGACLALDWPGEISELAFAIELLEKWAAEGSDPGICIGPVDSVSDEVSAFGRLAMTEVLTMPSAFAVAKTSGLDLRALGGSGQGIIGALASVGLRASGNDGRFLDLPGLRDLGERVTLSELASIGIRVEHEPVEGDTIADKHRDVYATLDWVRPRLVNGSAVWPVEWNKEQNEWIPLDRRRSRPLE